MAKEIKNVLNKTAKVAGVTGFAAGVVAVITCGVALLAITEGGKYLVDAVKRIVREDSAPAAAEIAEETNETAQPQAESEVS